MTDYTHICAACSRFFFGAANLSTRKCKIFSLTYSQGGFRVCAFRVGSKSIDADVM